MPVMDEFREEREALKNGTFKQKLQYFWDYYKWHVIGGGFGIILLVIFVKDMLDNKDFAFYGFFINTNSNEAVSTAFLDTFADLAGLDTENYAVMIDSSQSIVKNSHDEITMAAHQKLTISIMAEEVDFVAMDENTFGQYASTSTYFDLREVFSAEQLEKFEPYFYYIDMADVRKIEESRKQASYDVYQGAEYDHTSPEGLEDPVPIALYIHDSEKLKVAYDFYGLPAVLGIPLNTTHLDTTLQFIEYILE